MSENDSRPNMADPVGKALRGLASAVSSEVAAAGGAQLRARAYATPCRRRMRIAVPALSIAVAALVAAALLVIVFGPAGSHRATTTPNVPAHPRLASHASTVGGMTFVSYNLNQLVAQAPNMRVRSSTISYPGLGANYDAIAFGAGSTWVLEGTKPVGGEPAKPIGDPRPTSDCGALVRLKSSTVAATGTLALPGCPESLAFGDGSVWVLSYQIGVEGYALTRVDPTSLAVRSTTVIDGGRHGVVPQGDTGAKYLFVATAGASVTVAVQTADGASQVVTLDAKTLAEVGSVTVPQARGEVTALTANGSASWLGTDGGWLYRIDPRTGAVTSQRRLGTSVRSLSASDRAIWMTITLPSSKPASAYPGFDTLQLNPVTGAVERDTGLPLVLVAADGSDVWGIFATPRHGEYIARIDPNSRRAAGITSSPKAPSVTPDTIGVADRAAWIIGTNLQTLTKVMPSR
jgi:hypothetical protein